MAGADTNRMKQARRRLGGWRLTVLTVGLVSLSMIAIPAQAGLGDLLDDLLDPVGDVPIVGDIVDPIVEGVVDPIVDGIVDPVAGDLLDPIADEILAPVLNPIVEGVVAPIVDTVIPPQVPPVVPPVVEVVPPPGTTTTTAPQSPAVTEPAMAVTSESYGVSPSGYPGGAPIGSPATEPLGPTQVATELQSLQAALAVQTALLDNEVPDPAGQGGAHLTEVQMIDTGWLNGLTNWLRSGANGLLDLLAMPVRLLELLSRALLTAGSGLIAPLSMLLAFTAYLIKDRRWSGHRPRRVVAIGLCDRARLTRAKRDWFSSASRCRRRPAFRIRIGPASLAIPTHSR